MKSRQQCGKFFAHHLRKVKQNPLGFKISENSSKQNLVGATNKGHTRGKY